MLAKAASFNLDIALAIRTNNTQMILVINDFNLSVWVKRLLLSIGLWLLVKVETALDSTAYYLEPVADSTERQLFKCAVISIWLKHWLIAAGGELCKI